MTVHTRLLALNKQRCDAVARLCCSQEYKHWYLTSVAAVLARIPGLKAALIKAKDALPTGVAQEEAERKVVELTRAIDASTRGLLVKLGAADNKTPPWRVEVTVQNSLLRLNQVRAYLPGAPRHLT